MSAAGSSRTKVTYFYNINFNKYCYGEDHFMKPIRIAMTNELVQQYGLYEKMSVYVPQKARFADMTEFHTYEYIKFLETVTPNTVLEHKGAMKKFNMTYDCPVFEGLFDYCQLTAGGTLAAATILNKVDADICVNWSGGLHHAKQSKASGFCYVNDAVLGIIELLKYHQRVLYVDIDAHHGDGVEEAFFTSDRVMTVSFHMYGQDIFPGTGNRKSIGLGKGKYYSVNVPLEIGIDDTSYENIFLPIVTKAVEMFQPNIIVLQCGADSLTGDDLGRFSLSTRGHGRCVEIIKTFNLPLMLLGGGGYVVQNVAKVWTYETSIALGVDLPTNLPTHIYSGYYSSNNNLHVNPKVLVTNKTFSKRYISNVTMSALENLCMLPVAPSVQMQDIPVDALQMESDDEDDTNLLDRISKKGELKRVVPDNDFAENEGYFKE